jgi:hypothetical protein
MKGIANQSIVFDRFIRIRMKSIQILMSIVSLPFHYEHLQQHLFEDYLEKSHDVQTTIKTFSQYRFKIFPLLIKALLSEQDTTNAQLLFGEKILSEDQLNVVVFLSIGTIRLACSLAVHYDKQQEQSEDKPHKGNNSFSRW